MSGAPASAKVRLVVGNTGQGVFKNDGPFDAYIVTTHVDKLYEVRCEGEVVI